ncbi:MAG: type II toxin-antitoxin system RelE/ParE family toxin [Panacagrimonas sp.]
MLVARVKPRAAREILRAAEWWRDNRPAAPGAIASDVKAAVEVLVEQPGIGTQIENARDSNTRRLLLARTRYFIYYRTKGSFLEILAFWHSSRDREPVV